MKSKTRKKIKMLEATFIYAVSPGGHISSYLEDFSHTLKEISDITLLEKDALLDIIHNYKRVDEEIAEKLGKFAFNTEFWLRVQYAYDDYLAYKKLKKYKNFLKFIKKNE